MKKITSLLFLIMLSLASCQNYYSLERKYTRKSTPYYKECMDKIALQKDSFYISHKHVCIYKNERLQTIGKIENGVKTGIWYLYQYHPENDTVQLDLVLKYNKSDSTWMWTRGFRNFDW